MENCIPLNNNVLIERHKHTKDEVDIGNGKKLFIDTSWYEEANFGLLVAKKSCSA